MLKIEENIGSFALLMSTYVPTYVHIFEWCLSRIDIPVFDDKILVALSKLKLKACFSKNNYKWNILDFPTHY
jgi:hypothetical protein